MLLMSHHFLRMKRLYCKNQPLSLSVLFVMIILLLILRGNGQSLTLSMHTSVQTAPYRVLVHWIQVGAFTDHITCHVYWNNTDVLLCVYMVNSDAELIVKWQKKDSNPNTDWHWPRLNVATIQCWYLTHNCFGKMASCIYFTKGALQRNAWHRWI